MPEMKPHSVCVRCGSPLESGVCLRCLLLEAETVSPIGQRPLWESLGDSEEAIRVVGRYAWVECLGRGGGGEVYKARQLDTGRWVAVKWLSSSIPWARVEREIAALAALNHPQIVSVLDRGEHEGRAYLVLSLVEGKNLATSTLDCLMSPKAAAELIHQTALAIDYAHSKGVLHRDLKPHNILLDEKGVPHVTDFGLAHVDGDASLTQTGTAMGTPGYMAPEQVDPSLGKTTAQTDVYGLGASLYFLLTGSAPFVGESLSRVCHHVLVSEPASPTRVNASVPRDLEVICLACLEKAPEKRYASAQDVADECRRWLDGEPILRRPVSAWERSLRWARRHPAIASLWLLVLFLVSVGTAGVYWQWRQTRDANRRLASEVSRARRELAEQQFHAGTTAQGLRILAQHLRQQPEDEWAASRLWSALTHRSWSVPQWVVRSAQPPAAALPQPDEGQVWLLTAENVHSPQFQLQCLDLRTGKPRMNPYRLSGSSGNWGLSPDGQWMATTFGEEALLFSSRRMEDRVPALSTNLSSSDLTWMSNSRQILLLESNQIRSVRVPAAGTEVQHQEVDSSVRAAADADAVFSTVGAALCGAASSDEAFVASGDDLGGVRIWDRRAHSLFLERTHTNAMVRSVGLVSDDRFGLQALVTLQMRTGDHPLGNATGPYQTILYSVPSGERLAEFSGGILVAVAPTGHCALLSVSKGLECIDTQRGSVLKRWEGATSFGFTPEGDAYGIVHSNLEVVWIETSTQRPLGEPLFYRSPLEAAAFSPDGRCLAVPTSDGEIAIWRRPSRVETPKLWAPSATRQAFGVNGKRVAVSTGSMIQVLNTNGGTEFSVAQPTPIVSLALSDSGEWLAAGGSHGEVHLWNLLSRSFASSWRLGSNAIQKLTFSARGKELFAGTLAGELFTSEVPTGKRLEPTIDLRSNSPKAFGHFEIHRLRPFRDGERVAVACGSGRLFVFRVGRSDPVLTVDHGGLPLFEVALDASEQRMAVASFQGFAQVYDTATGRPIGGRLSHDDSVMSVAFHPDGKSVLTASVDRRAHVWEIPSGKSLCVTPPLEEAVFHASFSPDGRRFFTSTISGKLRLWDCESGLPLTESIDVGKSGQLFADWMNPNQILGAKPGQSLWLFDFPLVAGPVPSWVCDWAEALTGISARGSAWQDLVDQGHSISNSAVSDFWMAAGRRFFSPHLSP